MKNILLACALLLCSCCPMKKTTVNYTADSAKLVREVEYIEKLRDTVIYVTLPAENRETTVMQDSSQLETSAARSLARINSDGTLFHSLENKPIPLPVNISVKDTSVNKKEDSVKVKTEHIEIPKRMPLRWYEKALVWCGIAGICFAVVKTTIRILKRRIKPSPKV